MTRQSVVLALLLGSACLGPAGAAETCPNPEKALGVSRIVEIDPTSGPLFGELSKFEREPRFLGPKEVVLTFDDGPLPRYTKRILDTLDTFCTKATFFYVGEMAMAYPDMVKEVLGRGHTVGSHTWSHPLNMRRRSLSSATDQIERGFAAVALAAGKPIAPFFRFPGLSDSGPMLAYLQERGTAAFTVDIVSNDSYIGSTRTLVRRTLGQIEKKGGGIVLFHDIKAATARALPTILAALKKRGFKIVQLRSKTTFAPLPALTTALATKYAKTLEKKKGKEPAPAYTMIAPSTLGGDGKPAVTALAPPARKRTRAGGTHATAATSVTVNDAAKSAARQVRHKRRYRRRARVSTSIPPITNLGAAVSGQF